jgi:hypothetical protein
MKPQLILLLTRDREVERQVLLTSPGESGAAACLAKPTTPEEIEILLASPETPKPLLTAA